MTGEALLHSVEKSIANVFPHYSTKRGPFYYFKIPLEEKVDPYILDKNNLPVHTYTPGRVKGGFYAIQFFLLISVDGTTSVTKPAAVFNFDAYQSTQTGTRRRRHTDAAPAPAAPGALAAPEAPAAPPANDDAFYVASHLSR
jgi:hypothetical protein